MHPQAELLNDTSWLGSARSLLLGRQRLDRYHPGMNGHEHAVRKLPAALATCALRFNRWHRKPTMVPGGKYAPC